MSIFPHSVRDLIDSTVAEVVWEFYWRTNFTESNTWQKIELEPDWTLSEKVNQAAQLSFMPINTDLLFSDEDNPANRCTLAAQVKAICTVYDGDTSYSETQFLGEVRDIDPEDILTDLVALDPFAYFVTTDSEFFLEATRINIAGPVALAVSADYTGCYGISTATAAAFYGGNTSNPRRPWAQCSLIVYDSSGDPLDPEDYEVIPSHGLIRKTRDDANDPATIENVDVYQEGTLDISDPIKAALVISMADGGLGYTSANWEITRTCGTGSTDTVIVLSEGVRHLYPYHNVTIAGETRRIESRDLAAGTITLDSALTSAPAASTSVSYDTLNVGIDIQSADWDPGKGSNMDYWAVTRDKLAESVVLRYNPAEEVFEIIRYKQPATSDYTLPNRKRATSSQPRSLDEVFTRVKGTGTLERPTNLCSLATLTHVLGSAYPPHPGDKLKQYIDGEVVYYDSGYNPASDPSDPCDIHYLTSGDGNRSVGFHEGYSYAWKEFARHDFGETKLIRLAEIVAAVSQNSFEFGYWLQGSLDEATWYNVSPALTKRWLRPGEGIALERADLARPEMRYARLMVWPAKDGATNYNDPFLGAGFLGLYESTDYTVVAKLQDTNPTETVTVKVPYHPYTKTISTYGESILTRLGGRHRTAPPLKLDGVLNEVAAQELAYIELDSARKLYQRVYWTHVHDPYTRIMDAVSAEDSHNGAHDPLVEERIIVGGQESRFAGTDYNAEDL